MYETHESKINWKNVIKKGCIILCVLVIVLIIISLISKAFNKPASDIQPKENTPYTLSSQLDEIENALLKYVDENSMPKEINSSKTIRIKLLKESGLIGEIKDSENNSCESNSSFAEITRFEENYAVSITLTCGPHKENRLFYIGCFSECNGEVCKGTAESKDGVCFEGSSEEKSEQTDDKSNDTLNDKEEKTESKTKKDTTTKKPSKNTTTKKPNTTTKKPTTSTKPSTPAPKQTLYEYKKCTTTYQCNKGTLNTSTNKCEYTSGSNRLYADILTSTTTSTSPDLLSLSTSYKLYTILSYNDGIYKYKIYECADPSYEYSLYVGKCYKDVDNKVEEEPRSNTTCDYTWSYSESLDGWTRTGNTK